LRLAPRTVAIAFLAALAVVATFRRYVPNLISRFEFEDDARQHVWWTYRFADPALFPNDLAADYFSGFTFAPPGYQLLARAFVPFVDAQAFSEAVPFLLTAIVAVFAFRLGRLVSDGSLLGATTAAAFALMGGVLARVEGGLPRAWAMPVLLFGLWTLLRKRWILAGASLVATVLFYPPLVVNLGLLAAAIFALDVARQRRLPRGWIAGCVLAGAAAVVLFLEYRTETPDPFGPKVGEAEARAMSEFGPEGRSHFFSPRAVDYYVANERSGLGLEPAKLAAIVAALLLGVWLFPRAVPAAVWLIPVTSLAAYAAAHATLFKLHLPSRYVRFTFPAFLMLWLAAIVPRVVERLRRIPAVDRLFEAVERPRVLAALAAVAVLGLAGAAAPRIARSLSRQPRAGYPELMAFLASLPADSRLAAHPRDASDIPLLARRSVIACEETSTPYDLGYYGRMKERISAELAATYATEWSTVDRLHRDHGATAFVVDLDRYRRPVDPAQTYFEPFRGALRAPIAEGEKRGFALESPPADRVLFRAGSFVVVRLKPNG
jgi:hypothetical protein